MRQSEMMERLLIAYAPSKAASEIADEIGADPRYVRQVCRRRDLPLRRESTKPKGTGRGLTDYEPLGAGSAYELRQRREWPDDMKFVDAEGVR